MLDRKILRNEPDKVRTAAKNKGEPCPIDEWLELDKLRRTLLRELETLRKLRNERTRKIASLKNKPTRDRGKQ